MLKYPKKSLSKTFIIRVDLTCTTSIYGDLKYFLIIFKLFSGSSSTQKINLGLFVLGKGISYSSIVWGELEKSDCNIRK